MSDWSVLRTFAIEPPSGAAYDAAYVVRLKDDVGSTHDLIVEFEAPSAVASNGYAEEIARRYRGDSPLPRHVIVDVQKIPRVAAES